MFWVKNAKKKKIFFKKNGFESSFFFIKLTFRWLQTDKSGLKKTPNIEILLMVDLYTFLKKLHFSKKIEIFLIHQ